ncbi:MAG: metallophosphoesterase family protein [Myxococcota bacterium]
MQYAIFSDVHGNLEALRVVLNFFAEREVDRYVFLGDAVGYGASPDEVCDLIRPLVSHAVLGNHDAAVVGRMPFDEYYDAARASLDWCARQLKPVNKQWLVDLPYTDSDDTFAYCHGSPALPESFDYLFSKEQVREVAAIKGRLPHITLIGHSHLTLGFRVQDTQVDSMVRSEIPIDEDAAYILTVGSVGQPRDRDPRACCCTYDTDEGIFRYHRLDYDVLTARQRVHDAGLSPVFGDRLLVGM